MKKIASYAFFASLFLFIILWGYIPKLWLMSWPKWVLLGITITSLGAWVIFSLESLAVWIKKRATHYWIDMSLKAVAVVLILAVINWFAIDKNWKKDLTSNKLHSLSEQSVKILKELKEPITLTVWSSNLDEMTTNISARKFFENYKIQGNGKLNLEIKNPLEDPVGAEKDNVAKRRHLVIARTQEGSEARVENFSDARAEEMVTNAILQATKRGRKKTLCFISGHGELSTENTDAGGLSFLKERLVSAAYNVKDVTLATSETVPADCDALALVGPQGNPSEKEPKMVLDYLEQGGRILAFLGAGTSPVWKNLFKQYGVEVRGDLIVDPNVQPPIGVLTKNFAQDIDLTQTLNGMALMLQSSSIQLPSQSPQAGTTIRTFLSSEAYTYAKDGNLKSLKNLQKEGGDKNGPLPMGVLIEKTLKKETPDAEKAGKDPAETAAREMAVVVYGNHFFIANSFISQFLNMDLVLNSINFVMKDKSEMGIRPREIRQATLQLTNESINQVMATLALLGLLFVMGALWAKARRSHAT